MRPARRTLAHASRRTAAAWRWPALPEQYNNLLSYMTCPRA